MRSTGLATTVVMRSSFSLAFTFVSVLRHGHLHALARGLYLLLRGRLEGNE